MEYSQDGFCATWLIDLEWELWSEADRKNPTAQQEYTVLLSRELRILGEIAGGWWVYEDATRAGENGPVFVTMARWHELLADRASS